MACLPILEYPDPRLRTRAETVTCVDADVRTLVANLFETMYAAPGIGLAATQVDVHQRILVVDVSETRNQPVCLINPEILEHDGFLAHEEGCLSVPGIYEEVERADQIRLRALNQQGEAFEMEADGLLAVCIQHEIDHLDGKLFVDYLSNLKRERIRKRLIKQRRKTRGDAEASGSRSAVPVI